MWDMNNHHKTIMDYAKFFNKNHFIGSYHKNNLIVDHVYYTKIIKRDFPHLHCAINLMSKKSLIKYVQEKILEISPPEWHEFSKNRSRELRRLEGTIMFNQLLKHNLVHVWKQIYQDINEIFNEY